MTDTDVRRSWISQEVRLGAVRDRLFGIAESALPVVLIHVKKMRRPFSHRTLDLSLIGAFIKDGEQ